MRGTVLPSLISGVKIHPSLRSAIVSCCFRTAVNREGRWGEGRVLRLSRAGRSPDRRADKFLGFVWRQNDSRPDLSPFSLKFKTARYSARCTGLGLASSLPP